MSRSRGHRGWRSAAALAASVLVLGGLAGSAQASTVTVAPTNPSPGAGNNFPFGQATIWVPFAGFVYKNVPAFDLKTGDKLGFDLIAQNTTNIQLQVDLAATTTNGGDVPAGPFTTIVNNSNLPENPKGDTTPGNLSSGSWRRLHSISRAAAS